MAYLTTVRKLASMNKSGLHHISAKICGLRSLSALKYSMHSMVEHGMAEAEDACCKTMTLSHITQTKTLRAIRVVLTFHRTQYRPSANS